MSERILMSGLMSAGIPLNTRPLTLLTTLTLEMGTLGRATPCATTAGEEGRECSSEIDVPPLSKRFPVGEFPTEGKSAVFGEAEDIKFLVVYEI